METGGSSSRDTGLIWRIPNSRRSLRLAVVDLPSKGDELLHEDERGKWWSSLIALVPG